MLALLLPPQLVKMLLALPSGIAPRALQMLLASSPIVDLLRPWHRLSTGRS